MIRILDTASFSYPSENKITNEDFFLPPTLDNDSNIVLAIADGVGSSQQADLASLCAINAVANSINNGCFSVYNAFKNAMNEIRSLNINTATTLTILHVKKNEITVAHLGDCRAYFRKDNKLIQMTEDHTKYQSLMDSKEHSVKNLKNHKERLSSILTKALSRDSNFEPSLMKFDINEISNNNEVDVFLMSDGTYKHWDKRPKFSIKTMSSPSSFSSSLRKRIQKNVIDDYTFIGLKIGMN